MPKNKTGGKKSRKKSSKHENDFDEKLIITPDNEQEYGMITKILGNSRMLVDCLTTKIIDNKEEKMIINRMCTIRGKLKKRAWMNIGDIVIVALREELSGEKGDIIHKFSNEHSQYLKKNNKIPFDLSKQQSMFNKTEGRKLDTDENEFDFYENSEDENNNITKRNVGIQRDMDFPPADSSSDEEDNFNVDDIDDI
jgi:translation initiation factor 1A